MRQRESELTHSKAAQRAYALLGANKSAVSHQIHLRVVREFGLPGSAVQVLQEMSMYRHQDLASCGGPSGGPSAVQGACYMSPGRVRNERGGPPYQQGGGRAQYVWLSQRRRDMDHLSAAGSMSSSSQVMSCCIDLFLCDLLECDFRNY